MKTYKDIILEINSFKKTFRGIERMYPGVSQFLSVANRWILKAKRFKNPDLRRLMARLKRRPDVSDMSKADLKKIYDFIKEYKLDTIEDVRHVFADFSDFTTRTKDGDSRNTEDNI